MEWSWRPREPEELEQQEEMGGHHHGFVIHVHLPGLIIHGCTSAIINRL